MKEMEYLKRDKMVGKYGIYYDILAEGDFLDAHYAIISYGTHPCAYIFYEKGHPLFGTPYEEMEDLEVHGGFTFSEKGKFLPDGKRLHRDCWCLGWDYAHYDDYFPDLELGKKWTTAEILYEVKDTINKIAKMVAEGYL